MKKILSTVLALCMILGCVAAGFSAQAAPLGNELQAAINAAIAGDGECNWTGGDVELSKPLTINGNVKINFNGATIKGAAYKHTIIISGGNVELINADIEGIGGHYEGIINPSDNIRGFVDEIGDACPTIYIGGGNVTMTSLVVTGAQVRMIGTGAPHDIPKLEIPASDAITMANANAVLNLNNVRAFGNIGVENLYGSKVNVVDCLVGGYTKDFNDRKNVSFANGTTQYRNMDLVKEALADYVTLTEGEELYMNKFFNHFLQVTASVKNQNYVEPTYSYDAATDTLTVTATADKSYDVQAECAFDYYYVPKTATILGETKDFVKAGNLTYTATFEDIGPETVCDTDLIYKLAVGMDGDAQTMIDDALDMLADFIDGIPALLEQFNGEIDAAIEKYLTGEQGIARIVWNIYNSDEYEYIYNGMSDEEKAAAEADVKEFLGVMFDICGIDLRPLDASQPLASQIAAVRNGTATTAQANQVKNWVVNTNTVFGSTLVADTAAGKDLGKGLVDIFLDYWHNVKDYAVANGQFNDIKGLGEYIGANYESFYNDYLKGDMKPVLEKAAAILNDSDNFVMGLLANAGTALDLSSIGDISGYINMAYDYADRLFASNTYQSIVNTFGADVPKYCGIYAEKAFNIVTNPETYLDIETDGNLVEAFEFPQTATYTTPAATGKINVTVNVHGYGMYSVNGATKSSSEVYRVDMGSAFAIAPVEMPNAPEDMFKYIALRDTNGNERMVPNNGNLTIYSDTILEVYFNTLPGEGEDQIYEVTFMTNYELSTVWINTLVSDEIDELPEYPEFDGATFLGWSTENISGSLAQDAPDMLINEDTVLQMAANTTESCTFYAIYSVAQTTVAAALLANTMTMVNTIVSNHRAYFSVLFSDQNLASGDVIVEAGVLAAASEATINAATPNGGAGIIKGTADLSKYAFPLVYNYSVGFNSHNTDRTAYAKGYMIVKHADGTYSTEYTDVYNKVIAAY